jgi:hypothetical protein
MADRFDPNIPSPIPGGKPLIGGSVGAVVVIDPANTFPPFEVGNLVVDPTTPFTIEISWEVTGFIAPLWLAGLGGKWNVKVYAESLGGGFEGLLAEDNSEPAVPSTLLYSKSLVVAANTLPEANPGSQESGIYKLTAAVFLDSTIGPFDMIGFSDGPMIQVENPN